ncbi:MAG TPA: hypothetical protein VJ689_13275 [Gaiellaceae bacterium]|nr:hypothetical protein [Gaiellaceae bacterium]
MRQASLVLALLLAASLLTATAQAARAAEVVKFTAVTVSEKQPSEKTFISNDNVLIGGKKAGTDRLTCTVVSQTRATCKILIKLAGGTINAKMGITFTQSKGTGAITGGSGDYAGAKGSFTWKNLNKEGTRTAVVLTLV